MAKKKEQIIFHQQKQDPYIYLYLGEKRYYRLQPTPYAYKHPNYKKIKKNLNDTSPYYNYNLGIK
jgi:hypothetical protein